MLKFFVCTVDEQEVVLLFLYKAQVALQCYLLCRNQELLNYDTKIGDLDIFDGFVHKISFILGYLVVF